MSPPYFHIRGVETDGEREAVRGLLRSEFDLRPGLGAAFGRLYDRLLDGDARVSFACSRIALVGKRVVGHILLAPRSFWIDGIALPGGILAMTVVAPDCRGQGIGSALVRDAEGLAKGRGLLLLHLAGDLRFYRRFGYVEAYLRCRAGVDVAFEGGRTFPRLRRAGPTDAAALARVSRCEIPEGAVEPTPDRWRWVLETGHPFGLLRVNDILLGFCAEEDFCWVLKEERVRGVVRAAGGGGTLAVYEAAAESREAAVALLEAVCGFAGRSGYRRLSFHLPPANRLVQAAGCRLETGPDPELLVKLLDAPALLTRLCPLLGDRLKASDLWAWKGRVAIRTEQDECVLVCEQGELKAQAAGEAAEVRVRLPEIGLARALLGTDRLAERMEGRSGADAEIVALMDALFPRRSPFFWLADSL